jgi:hypothetical protein
MIGVQPFQAVLQNAVSRARWSARRCLARNTNRREGIEPARSRSDRHAVVRITKAVQP